MYPLTLQHLLWRMRSVHPNSEVVTVTGQESDLRTHRTTHEKLSWRIEALANGLSEEIGVNTGDMVTVLGWNDQEHLELLLAVPLTGARVNSVNLRLGPPAFTQLASNPLPRAVVVNSGLFKHAAVGADVTALVSELRSMGVTVVRIGAECAPLTDQVSVLYENLITPNLGRRWEAPLHDENLPAFTFHTSGTTGLPKSYDVSHRMAMLHCLSQAAVDASGISHSDTVMPLAPFFHVNGWGLPLTCTLTGASMVLVGGDLQPARIARIMSEEGVTVAAAVPTVWYDICAAIDRAEAGKPAALREVLTGGSPLPESLWRNIQSTLGVSVASAWGMTETMACSTYERELPCERAGKPIALIELELDDSPGRIVGSPELTGRLKVRGPFVLANNHEPPGTWFTTGDVASIDAQGSLILRDRENDLIKSGGEWIASAEIEKHLSTHPNVASAIVVPVKDPKWIERPLAYVVLSKYAGRGDGIEAALRAHAALAFPRWWIPDKFIVLDELPLTTVGKIDKRFLRKLAESKQEEV